MFGKREIRLEPCSRSDILAAVEEDGRARGGGLAPERRGVGAIKMHPMELPMEKDGTETRQPEEVEKAEEDAQEAAAAAAAGK